MWASSLDTRFWSLSLSASFSACCEIRRSSSAEGGREGGGREGGRREKEVVKEGGREGEKEGRKEKISHIHKHMMKSLTFQVVFLHFISLYPVLHQLAMSL